MAEAQERREVSSVEGVYVKQSWELLESAQAKHDRGRGWYSFCKIVKAERNYTCEHCGDKEFLRELRSLLSRKDRQRITFHLHHKKKLRTNRHLKFERSNIILCCQVCHNELEKTAKDWYGTQ